MLRKAGDAKNSSTEAEVLEKLKLAYEDYYLGQHTGAGYTFQTALDKIFGTGVATASGPDSNGVYTVSVNGKKYDFNVATGTAGEHIYVDPFNYGTGKTKETVVAGDVISIGAENFKVISNANGTILAMPYYNLKLNSSPMRQATTEEAENGQEGNSSFSSTSYFNVMVDEVDISDSTNNIKGYINSYRTTLIGLGVEEITVRAARESELTATGVSAIMRNPGQMGYYWVGSSNERSGQLYTVWANGSVDYSSYGSEDYGVRPVIEIH